MKSGGCAIAVFIVAAVPADEIDALDAGERLGGAVDFKAQRLFRLLSNGAHFRPEAGQSRAGQVRVIRWKDVVHESVTFRADTKTRQHNNPPANLAKVDDTGNSAGTFAPA